MAKVPTQAQVEKARKATEAAEAKKLESQKKKGKGFVNLGQGVMPESVWNNLPGKKDQDGSK